MSDLHIEFIPGDEIRIPDTSIPLTLTIVIAKYQNRTLVLYSPERQVWEAPGGGINPGETAHDCARREVLEETSQVIDALNYKGLFKVQFDGKPEYGALFAGEIRELRPFTGNEEAERIALVETWDELEGRINALSRTLSDYC